MYPNYTPKSRHRLISVRTGLWLGAGLLLVTLLAIAWIVISGLKANTVINNARVHTTVITASATQHYQEAGFSLDLPSSWLATAKPIDSNRAYSWQSTASADQGQSINLYEDQLPTTFPVNRVVVVSGAGNHLQFTPQVSPLCTSLSTTAKQMTGPLGFASNWQGVNFLCDRRQNTYTITGLASSQAINSVSLRSPSTGQTHTFFLTDINYDPAAAADYQPFYQALSSLRLQ